MSNYQVLARKYRPQSFTDVLGQEAIVTTLKNAIKYQRLAHAYLFCGSRGTGKTTLARVFAKALNCQSPTNEGEPCGVCSSCKEITTGHSLDVLEIDGASHRGIDDIRQINETVGYSAASGKYKIYIIDEVHMLTKEAFNALLKTLEEPPAKVMFLFATTEPHKVLPTILSRCQRFNLNRIPLTKIIEKLKRIALEQSITIEDDALQLLAQRADGGLRDAESLFDQIIAFHEGSITVETVADVLGVVSKDVLFQLDQAGKQGQLAVAFEIAHQIFSQGKDILHFIDSLTDHFRTILLIKLSGSNAPFLTLSESDKGRYESSSKIYSQEQCLTIVDFLIEAQNNFRFQSSGRIALEAILMRIMRTHQRLPVEFLVRRLTELEQALNAAPLTEPLQKTEVTLPKTENAQANIISASTQARPALKESEKEVLKESSKVSLTKISQPLGGLSEDPTPSPQDLGLRKKAESSSASSETLKKIVPSSQEAPNKRSSLPTDTPVFEKLQQSRYDTLLNFSAVELEGTIQKKQIKPS